MKLTNAQHRATLRKVRRAVDKHRGPHFYLVMCEAMPFPELWECISFMSEHQIHGHRQATILRSIDKALAAIKPKVSC